MIQKIEISSWGQFVDKVLDYDGIIFAYFYAEWCGPCRRAKHSIEKLSETYKVVGIDVDKCLDVSRKMAITSIPTVIAFNKGNEISKKIGISSHTDYLEMADGQKNI